MTNVLMPLARKIGTEDIVSIEHVPSGASCNCECVSCGVRVIARKGKINAHSFAHEAKMVSDDNLCQFSLSRAVYWMASKALLAADSITLPRYIYEIDTPYFSETHTLTDENCHRIDAITELEGHFKLEIKGYPIVIIMQFGCPTFAPGPFVCDGHAYPYIKIGLDEIQDKVKLSGRAYSELISALVLHDTSIKSWGYHPRQKKIDIRYSMVLAAHREKEQVLLKARDKHRAAERDAELVYSQILEQKKIKNQQSIERRDENDRRFKSKYPRLDAATLSTMRAKRLSELVAQASYFATSIEEPFFRCNNCYFLSGESNECQHCGFDDLEKLTKNDLLPIEPRYKQSSYNHYSLMALPESPPALEDKQTNQ